MFGCLTTRRVTRQCGRLYGIIHDEQEQDCYQEQPMNRMPSRRPIIGIPCSIYPDSWYTPANGNAISYLRALEAAGGIPALIHLTRDAEVIDVHYTRCDALLFAGG